MLFYVTASSWGSCQEQDGQYLIVSISSFPNNPGTTDTNKRPMWGFSFFLSFLFFSWLNYGINIFVPFLLKPSFSLNIILESVIYIFNVVCPNLKLYLWCWQWTWIQRPMRRRWLVSRLRCWMSSESTNTDKLSILSCRRVSIQCA